METENYVNGINYVNLTPHPSLVVAWNCVEALKVEGFTFVNEQGENVEGAALIAISKQLVGAEWDGTLTFTTRE